MGESVPAGPAEHADGTGARGPRPGPGTPESQAAQPQCKDARLAPAPLRRLTRAEYNQTVRDLLGVASRPADVFPPEEVSPGFGPDARYFTVSPLLAERYGEAASKLASDAIRSMAGKLPCTAAPDEACARRFAETLGGRAYRRPLTTAELDRFVALHRTVARGWDAAHGLQAVAEAILQSPHFLYKVETGQRDPRTPGLRRLTSHEVATRLSYYLWGTMPDTALFDRAAKGALATREQVLDVARAMAADPRAHAGVRAFFDHWLDLGHLDEVSKDAKVYPLFTPALREAMRVEAEALTEDLVWRGEGLRGLLTAAHTFVNEPLAALHGVKAPAKDAFGLVDLDPGRRAGVLTLPAVLATHAKPNQTSPVRRGMFLRERFLCQRIPDPPPGLMVSAPDPAPGLSTRERFAAHVEDASCAGCHRLMDPMGFGLESFDGIGRFRTEDGGKPVDDAGEVVEGGSVNGRFKGAAALARRFADSEEVAACFVQQWYQAAMGRARLEGDACAIETLTEQFAAAKGDVRELLVAVTQSDAFLFLPEVTP